MTQVCYREIPVKMPDGSTQTFISGTPIPEGLIPREVLFFENEAGFPQPGDPDKLYVSRDTNTLYVWDET